MIKQTYDMILALEHAQSHQAVVGGLATLFLAFTGLLLYYRTTCLH